MFKRYTDPAKRAIYYAHYLAITSDHTQIATIDVLRGLLIERDSRVHTLFPLREHFPLYNGCPCKYEKLPKPPTAPHLSDAAKQALAWAATEANELRDYWIDTEHLLLGILRVRQSDAAVYLAKAGLTLASSRRVIKENRSSRPNYGPVSRWWQIKTRLLYPIPS